MVLNLHCNIHVKEFHEFQVLKYIRMILSERNDNVEQRFRQNLFDGNGELNSWGFHLVNLCHITCVHGVFREYP